MKTGLIITGGQMDLAFAREFCRHHSFDKVIAVDAGLEWVKALGLTPDIVVGDFDTVSRETLEDFRKIPFIIWDSHQPEKNETDTEIALDKAMAYGCTAITLLGATGGRFDHMLCNVFLLYRCLMKGIDACIVDRQNKIFLIEEEHTFVQDQVWGKYISFLPLLGEVAGITLKGFKYPLDNYTLEAASSRCISNELQEKSGTITFTKGIAICVEASDG